MNRISCCPVKLLWQRGVNIFYHSCHKFRIVDSICPQHYIFHQWTIDKQYHNIIKYFKIICPQVGAINLSYTNKCQWPRICSTMQTIQVVGISKRSKYFLIVKKLTLRNPFQCSELFHCILCIPSISKLRNILIAQLKITELKIIYIYMDIYHFSNIFQLSMQHLFISLFSVAFPTLYAVHKSPGTIFTTNPSKLSTVWEPFDGLPFHPASVDKCRAGANSICDW